MSDVFDNDYGFLYCIFNSTFYHEGDIYYKLGYAFDVSIRLAGYTTYFLSPCEVMYVTPLIKNKKIAEKMLFDKLKNHRLLKNREYFKCDLEIIKKEMNNIAMIFITHDDCKNKQPTLSNVRTSDLENIRKPVLDNVKEHDMEDVEEHDMENIKESDLEDFKEPNLENDSDNNNNIKIKPVVSNKTKEFNCKSCKYHTAHLSHFKNHMLSKKHLSISKKSVDDNTDYTKYKNTIYHCDTCDKFYKSKQSLSKHKKKCNSNIDNVDNINNGSIEMENLKNEVIKLKQEIKIIKSEKRKK